MAFFHFLSTKTFDNPLMLNFPYEVFVIQASGIIPKFSFFMMIPSFHDDPIMIGVLLFSFLVSFFFNSMLVLLLTYDQSHIECCLIVRFLSLTPYLKDEKLKKEKKGKNRA